ncbi:hypothetical protein [Piscirickettsia salmonis]|uniref:hypothetical protein n=1 Tax=Piscirickettsia salmonis TaxID=1238 RepID=UPI0012B7BE45|nr:hypothetical protein [Piscirickettsia salmonis]
MLGDFASLDVQNTYRGSDAYALVYGFCHNNSVNLTVTQEIKNDNIIRDFKPFKVGLQIPYCVFSKVKEKSSLMEI